MTATRDRQHSPYTPAQLFALVADVERYPEFLPWCVAARIISPPPCGGRPGGGHTRSVSSGSAPTLTLPLREREETEFLAELAVRFKGMTERYTSRVSLTPPDAAGQGGMVRAEMVRGPFSHLVNEWRFAPEPGGGTTIDFFLDFAFNSKLLEMMLGGIFGRAQTKMIEAFCERADALYKGENQSSVPRPAD